MQEKIEINLNQPEVSKFFLPEILSLQQQKQKLECLNHNSANLVCISSECSLPGLMCFETICQCRKIHYKCHYTLLDRVLESILKHQKQIPQETKEIYNIIRNQINQMIEKLSQLRAKFEKEEQYFGLKQQQLQFINLIQNQRIQEINGKMISTLQKNFDSEIQFNKFSKQEVAQDFSSKRIQFNKLYKSIEQCGLFNFTLQNKTLFNDSKILKSQKQKYYLNKWICESFKDVNKKWSSQLLFRASQHDFSIKQFHKICDKKRDTLLILKNQFNRVIGGFTSEAWNNENKWITDKQQRSFLFSLTLKEKYNCLNPQFSIYGNQNRGPHFGNGTDLIIYDKCNNNNDSYASLGLHYNLEDKKYNSHSQYSWKLFTGNQNGKNFKIQQYQIYQIK